MKTFSARHFAMIYLPLLALLISCLRAGAQEKGEPGKFDFYLMNLAWGPEFCSGCGFGV